MTTSETILKIKNCIKDAHSFSENLGKSTSIHRNYLIRSLCDISSTQINVDLLEMKNNSEIEFNVNDLMLSY